MSKSSYQKDKPLSNPNTGESKKNLSSLLEKTARIVDPLIEELLTSYVDERTKEIVNYQASTGGKRIRPALAILSCQLLGGKIEDVLYPAAGLEILHNYSLIIDDIIDNSNLRRGELSCWAKFGKSIAQCIGVDYSAAIFQAANKSKESVKISELFAKTMKIGVDGEILDILFEQSGRKNESYVVENRYREVTKEDYLEMISKKTAFLFQTSCEVGGICAGANHRKIEALKNYGFNLGMGFQIQDDILDIFGKKRLLNKGINKDIIERKRGNIVILLALKELPVATREKFLAIIGKKKIKEADIEQALNLIKKVNAYQKARELGKSFIEKSKENLKLLPQNKQNNILEMIAEFVIERER